MRSPLTFALGAAALMLLPTTLAATSPWITDSPDNVFGPINVQTVTITNTPTLLTVVIKLAADPSTPIADGKHVRYYYDFEFTLNGVTRLAEGSIYYVDTSSIGGLGLQGQKPGSGGILDNTGVGTSLSFVTADGTYGGGSLVVNAAAKTVTLSLPSEEGVFSFLPGSILDAPTVKTYTGSNPVIFGSALPAKDAIGGDVAGPGASYTF